MEYCFSCPYCGCKLLKAADGRREVVCSRCGEKFVIEIKGNSLDIELIQESNEV